MPGIGKKDITISRAILTLADRIMANDSRVNWAGLYIGSRGILKLAIYHDGAMSLHDLTMLVHEMGGAELAYLLQVPGFGAKKVSPRVPLPRYWFM